MSDLFDFKQPHPATLLREMGPEPSQEEFEASLKILQAKEEERLAARKMRDELSGYRGEMELYRMAGPSAPIYDAARARVDELEGGGG